MAISNFTFSKSWRNPDEFPTYQSDETQVRDDMQCLYDEIAKWLNETLIPGVNRIDGKVDVVNLEIRADGHLIITDSLGQETDVGQVVPDTPHTVSDIKYELSTGVWTITYLDGKGEQKIQGIKKLADLTQDESHRTVTDTEKQSWGDMMPRSGGEFTGRVAASHEGQNPGDAVLRNTAIADGTQTMFYTPPTPQFNGEIVFYW